MAANATGATATLFIGAAFTAAAIDTDTLIWEVFMAVIGALLSTLIIPLASGKSKHYRLRQYAAFTLLAVIAALIIHRLGDNAPLTDIDVIDGFIVALWAIETDLRCLFIGYLLPTIIHYLPKKDGDLAKLLKRNKGGDKQ